MKSKTINEVGILIQAVLLVSLLYAFVLTMFMKEFVVFLDIVAGLNFFILGYNNLTIRKNTIVAVISFVLGAVSFLSGLL